MIETKILHCPKLCSVFLFMIISSIFVGDVDSQFICSVCISWLLSNAECVPIVQAAKAARLEKFEIPARIILLPEPWTPESGLVTAALKLKREQLKAKFKDDLNKLYQ